MCLRYWSSSDYRCGLFPLKGALRLAKPYVCEFEVSTFTFKYIKELLDLKEYQLPLQAVWVTFDDDSRVFDQTALVIVSDMWSGMKVTVIVCPGHYVVHGTFFIGDLIELEVLQDFLSEHCGIPKIPMVNNIMCNNEDYDVLVIPSIFSYLQENAQDEIEENEAVKIQVSREVDAAETVCLEELIQCAAAKMELYARADLSKQVEGNCEIVNELVAASTQKG